MLDTAPATELEPTAATAPLLELEDLHTHYQVRQTLSAHVARRPRRWVRAVDGVSFSLERGELLALVGESGSGKTTIAQTILRMIDPTSGRIRLDGTDITSLAQGRMRPFRRRMQMIYQDPYESLDPRFRVRQTVEEPMLIHGIGTSRRDRRGRVRQALERAGLSPAELYLDRYPHELSGGQRQRVAIATALVLEPLLLLADEPVSMLDVSVRAGILSLLNDLRRDGRMSVLMITHDLSTAAHVADRIAVMYLGRIVELAPAREIVQYPQHPYTRALLSVVPKRDPRASSERQILRGEIPDATSVPSGCRFHPRCPVAEARCVEIDPELRPLRHQRQAHHDVACLLAPTRRRNEHA